jgi:hypothetical protein
VYDEAGLLRRGHDDGPQPLPRRRDADRRIFNSIMADETVVLNDATAHIEPVEEYARSIEASPLEIPRRIMSRRLTHTVEVELHWRMPSSRSAMSKDTFALHHMVVISR